MKKNITRVDALNTAINMITNTIELNGSGDPDEAKLTETVEVLASIRDTISKANSRKSDKPTKTQVENEGVKTAILAVMTREGQTISEIASALGGAYTPQKVMALVRQLIQAGQVERFEDKRKALFRLA